MTRVPLRSLAVASGLLIAAATGPAIGQESPTAGGNGNAFHGPTRDDFIAAPPAGLWSANDMIGLTVHDGSGANLGPVVDVLLGDRGESAYIVFETGGFLGSGEKLIAAPLRTFHIVATDPAEEPRPTASAILGTELPPQNAQEGSGLAGGSGNVGLKPLFLELDVSEDALAVAPPFSRNPKRIPAVAP